MWNVCQKGGEGMECVPGDVERVWSVYQRGWRGYGVCTRGCREGVECVPEGVGEGMECVPEGVGKCGVCARGGGWSVYQRG